MANVVVRNSIPDILHNLDYIRRHELHVGVFHEYVSPRVLIAAWVNEFGAVIPMTERQRRWFWAMMRRFGIPRSPRPGGGPTGVIVIPARSYMRAGVQERAENIGKTGQTVLREVLEGRRQAQEFFDAMAAQIRVAIVDKINRIFTPPLHPLTVAMKRSDKPLVHTGALRAAIRARVVEAV